jgi:hypothetical protein
MKQSGTNSNGRHAAFTRVDLAVVVGTVAALLVIAFSAYAKPRNRVFQITDVSNHRRIMQAMISFAADNADRLPNPGWGTVQKSWLYGANFPSGAANSPTTYNNFYSQQLGSFTNSQLFPYLHDSKVLMCPADRPDNALFWARNVYLASYTWNDAVDGYGSLANLTPSAYKLSQFRPDAILEWEGDERVPFYWNDASNFPNEGISQRHGTNVMVGMFGGSVAAITIAGFNTMVAASAANRLWCNPGTTGGR